ncbi:hypothetical protein Tco_1200662 [Tanacetum coccineum]
MGQSIESISMPRRDMLKRVGRALDLTFQARILTLIGTDLTHLVDKLSSWNMLSSNVLRIEATENEPSFSSDHMYLSTRGTNEIVFMISAIESNCVCSIPLLAFEEFFLSKLNLKGSPCLTPPSTSTDSEGPSEPVQDDSPVEEEVHVKRKYTKRRQQVKKNEKDLNDSWSLEEEIALCKAWDIRRIGRAMSKKKASSSTTSSESLSAGEVGLVDVLLIKWENVAMSLFFQRQQPSSKYLRIKERELKLKN